MAGSRADPLTALLSRALVAFTIELDNEWERRMPRFKTTDFGGRGVWGVSLRQWLNFLQFVPPDGIAGGDLTRVSRAKPALDGMRRWGYVSVTDRFVRLTSRGAVAAEVCAPLPAEIESRWASRCGPGVVAALRGALAPVAERRGDGMPDWLTFNYGGFAAEPVAGTAARVPAAARPLATLLSVVLQSLALDYERSSGASLQFTANVLQWLGFVEGDGIAVAELPAVSGVAAPALAHSLGVLAKRGYLTVGSGRGRRAVLTGKGAAEVALYRSLPAQVEADSSGAADVRRALERLFGSGGALWPALDPPAESWRAQLPAPARLPDMPNPRQGGHPDGV